MAVSSGTVNLLEQLTIQGNMFTSLLGGMMEDTSEQPDEEMPWARSERI